MLQSRFMIGSAGAIAAGAALMTYVVRSPYSSLLSPSAYRGPRHRREIALTFDDGPTPGTLQLLSLLREENVAATFFMCGANVDRHPGIARAVAESGHEIANHSYSHARFWLRSVPFIEQELSRAQESIQKHTGVCPTLCRPPYGVRWFGMRGIQSRLGVLSVMWTVLALDWKLPADQIADRVFSASCNGAIVCLHDGRELQTDPDISRTLEAVRRLIPLLRQKGFEFRTVSSLLWPKN